MTTFRAVILRGNIHTKQDGTTNVKIRITHNRKQEYISTDVFVFPDTFRKGQTGDEGINARIAWWLNDVHQKYIRLGEQAMRMSPLQLKKNLINVYNGDISNISFHDFADLFIKRLKKQNRQGYVRGFTGLLSHLKRFRPRLDFADVTRSFLSDFEAYLRCNGVSDAVSTYMAKLRVIFNSGRDEYNDEESGIIRIQNYPFRHYRIKQRKQQRVKDYLTVEQCRELVAYHPATYRQELGRDVFLIMLCLIGINSKDLYNIRQLPADRFEYRRAKTGRKYSIRVEPELIPIISKYTDIQKHYCDHLNFQKAVNKGLKEISEARGWRRVTSNWARHTWATIARNDCGIDKDTISRALGHSSGENVTDAYIRYSFEVIDRANRMVLDKVFQ
jgi:integrase